MMALGPARTPRAGMLSARGSSASVRARSPCTVQISIDLGKRSAGTRNEYGRTVFTTRRKPPAGAGSARSITAGDPTLVTAPEAASTSASWPVK
ncbi:MAG: hypothetical protein AUG10_05990 [Gemmatimonadetes bacterium 13_1_20CM_2_70_10]|nr:MAG: hypothetical protein AUG10_05990 [Gemmatimonadetes bacterium 13_1_20CM_2_70_10]